MNNTYSFTRKLFQIPLMSKEFIKDTLQTKSLDSEIIHDMTNDLNNNTEMYQKTVVLTEYSDNEIRDRTDEESTMFKSEIEDSEVTITDKEIDESHSSVLREAIEDLLMDTRFFFFLIASIFGIMGFFLWDTSINIKVVGKIDETNSSEGKLALHYILFAITGTIVGSIFLGLVIEGITFKILKKIINHSNSLVFYLNVCAYHIALCFVLVCLLITILTLFDDFYIVNSYFPELRIGFFIPITIVFTFFFGLEQCMTQNTRFSFNYSTYLKRIKRAIFMDIFISIMTQLKDFKHVVVDCSSEDENENILNTAFSDDYIDDNDIFVPMKKTRKKTKKLMPYMFDKQFIDSTHTQMPFSTKKLLINEFEKLCRPYRHQTNTILNILTKIKDKAKGKAKILYKILCKDGKIKKLGDFKFVFKNHSIFNEFLEQMGLNKSILVTQDFLEFFIEKNFKEKCLISYSLKQLHAAIDRISFTVQVLIGIIYSICIITSGMGLVNSMGGIASTFFGIPIIASLLKEQLIHPIMFLFIIHPFDVGDRVEIMMNGVIENLVVSELNVFSTQFFRWDGTSFFVPNTLLSQTSICNIRRSGPKLENNIIQISADTNPQKLVELKKRLQRFVKKFPTYYTDYILVNYEKIDDSTKLHIKVLMQYKTNIQNYEHYLTLKSNFICYLNKEIINLGIKYDLPVQKISLEETHISKKTSTFHA